MRPGFLFLSLIVILLGHVCVVYCVLPSEEVQAILDLRQAFNLGLCLSSWNTSDTSTICNWDYINCNTAQTHVTGINFEYAPPDLDRCWIGQWPESIVNLTALSVLKTYQGAGRYIGIVPPAILSMPSLTQLDLSFNGAVIQWPTQPLSPSLRLLFLKYVRFLNGTMPENTDLPNLENFSFRYSNLRCPLPPKLVERLSQLPVRPDFVCNMYGSYLDLIDEKVCGQLELSAPCVFMPYRHPPNIGSPPTFPVAQPATYTVKSSKIQVEIFNTTVSVFALDKAGQPFKEEYFEFRFQDWLQGGRFTSAQNFRMGPFGPLATIKPGAEWKTNTSIYSPVNPYIDATVEWTFYVDPPNRTLVEGFKFSLRVINHNITYIQPESAYKFLSSAGNWVFRVPHSTATSIVKCTNSGGSCKSDNFELKVNAYFVAPYSVYQTEITTRKTRMAVSFPSNGIVDGQDVYAEEDLKVVASYFFEPLGHQWFVDYHGPEGLDPGPEKDQSFSMDYQLFMKLVRHTAEYDPGFSIELLFDGGDAPLDAQAASARIGIAVGVTVAAVAVIVAGTSVWFLRKRIAPYAQRESPQQTEKMLNIDVESEEKHPKGPGWVSGAAPKK